MNRLFETKNGRISQVIGLERALDVCSTDCKMIGSVVCLDIATGDIWTTDIEWFNPLKLLSKQEIKLVYLLDKNSRNEYGFQKTCVNIACIK